MGTVALIIVLLVAAMLLIVVEICTPTFGILGVTAVGCVAWAVYLCWTIHPTLGIVALIGGLIGLPVYIAMAIKIIPQTALGKRLGLEKKKAEPGSGTPESSSLKELVGRETYADTVLRPSGTIRVDGRRIVAQAESGMIEKGTLVRIVRSGGNYVVVRPAEQQPAT
jgi:membrane-bound serine protease (ClpP class)